MRPKTWPGADWNSSRTAHTQVSSQAEAKEQSQSVSVIWFWAYIPHFQEQHQESVWSPVSYWWGNRETMKWTLKELSGMNVKKTPIVQVTEENKLVELARKRRETKARRDKDLKKEFSKGFQSIIRREAILQWLVSKHHRWKQHGKQGKCDWWIFLIWDKYLFWMELYCPIKVRFFWTTFFWTKENQLTSGRRAI